MPYPTRAHPFLVGMAHISVAVIAHHTWESPLVTLPTAHEKQMKSPLIPWWKKVGEISSHQGKQRQTLVRHAPPGSSVDTAARIPSGSPGY